MNEADVDLTCRCRGLMGDCRCEEQATEEDGLCGDCRCPHGSCQDHDGWYALTLCDIAKRGLLEKAAAE